MLKCQSNFVGLPECERLFSRRYGVIRKKPKTFLIFEHLLGEAVHDES